MARPHTLHSRLRQLAGGIAGPLRRAAATVDATPPAAVPADVVAFVREPARSRIWPAQPYDHPGIDWNPEGQRGSCATSSRTSNGSHCGRTVTRRTASTTPPTAGQYPPLDAWILEGVLRHLRAAAMIEVGSGFSSLITAQVNREHFDGQMRFSWNENYLVEAFLQFQQRLRGRPRGTMGAVQRDSRDRPRVSAVRGEPRQGRRGAVAAPQVTG